MSAATLTHFNWKYGVAISGERMLFKSVVYAVLLLSGLNLAEIAHAAQKDVSNKISACPEPDFDAFLTRFGRETEFQEKSVADPLESAFIDPDAQPEPRVVRQNIPLRDVQWPVIPDLASLSETGQEFQVSNEADGGKKVLIRKPDTGDQQSYYFAQKPCWQLIGIYDEAL